MRAHPTTTLGRTFVIVWVVLASATAAFLMTAPTATATTYVRGLITTDTTWGFSDTMYVATYHVTVRSPATLTILPGTTVKFDSGVHLYIEGSLVADGTATSAIIFTANNTGSPIPWGGIQFNASSSGSISWSTFDRVDRAVTATVSSPSISSNTVLQAGVGFVLVRSTAFVSSNVIKRASSVGIYANASDARIVGNAINGTGLGIQVEQPSAPTISGNTITNVSGVFAVGILVNAGATAAIDGNTITGVRGVNGGNGLSPGAPGRDGAFAVGIYVTAAPSASITTNTVDTAIGGRGGDGQANPGGTGGRGGNGGSAAGIVVGMTSGVDVSGNTITNLQSGAGGNGGGGATTANGGSGGNGGTAVGVEAGATSGFAQLYTNAINGVTGGAGGAGATGGTTSGNGGVGGDADGLFFITAENADAGGNSVSILHGGLGGNGGVTAGGGGNGGTGGGATAVLLASVVGSASVGSSTMDTLAGGDGGRGAHGGYGGNATGVLSFGYNDGRFNATAVNFNLIQTVTGGAGGIGSKFGGNGGSASGIAAVYLAPTLDTNQVYTLQGGRGGDSLGPTNGGRGGDAIGIVAGLVRNGVSLADTISGVTKGAAGTGPPVQASYANGYYLVGNRTLTIRFTVENASLSSVGSYEFYVDNYTEGFAVNTPFTKLAVMAAGNLTVQNFLEVDALWPNGLTPVAGAHVLVEDNGSPIWDRSSPSGIQPWILVTDRVYIDQPRPTDNVTRVTVTYSSYSFANDPRFVDMGTSHTEPFVMVDRDPPTSAATPLPAYENTQTFTIGYTASDGNGTGLGNITLWVRTGGGGWSAYATQPAGNLGQFTFTASADGVYEFATTADDRAGNVQSGPSANNTWTTVDTVRPGSHVNSLSPYQNSASFLVSWAPDAGVTDIATYTIQYNLGTGWTNWLGGTTATSATFNSGNQGAIAFRSIATDRAGNVEVAPAGNDTWTIVDTIAPFSHTLPLPTYETSLGFTVSWGPQFDSSDIASYRVQVRDNGGSWSDWLVSTGTSATFTGQDGHTYEFRSIATDRAGNVEAPLAGNDSWTIVDVTPPNSIMTSLPAFENRLQFAVSWGSAVGTTDIATYTILYDVGAGWTNWLVGTAATTGTFTASGQGVVAFRSIATDRAGNVEPAPAGNDTWTMIDITPPSVTDVRPVGPDTNTTPWIRITFTEGMDRASVEQAFSISPAVDGSFQWSADSRSVTFVPTRELQSGTMYFVVVDTSARDLAGNTMGQSKTFQFETAPGFLATYWWLFAIAAAGVAGTLFFLVRRGSREPSRQSVKAASRSSPDAIIEDVFLLNAKDGLLIKHETRRLRPDVDTDILSGMLTAVQAFVKDALRGDDLGELDEMTVGQMHILIGRGKWLVLAARIEGDGTESWTEQIERCIRDMEDHHWDQLEDWDGDMGLARVLAPYIKKLIQGGYAVAAATRPMRAVSAR